MTKASFPVRFMGRHPVFGKSKKTKSEAGEIKNTVSGVRYKLSPYYWWWCALRESDAYEKVCASKGRSGTIQLKKSTRILGMSSLRTLKIGGRKTA